MAETVGADGNVTRSCSGMTLDALKLADRDIPLKVHDVTNDCMIETKDFGSLYLKVNFGTFSAQVLVTPNQEEAFKKFLASTPPAAKAVPVPLANPNTLAPTAASPEPPDKVVLKVGNQQFTKADIDKLIVNLDPRYQQSLATRGKKELGDQYALLVMFAQQARLLHLDEKPDFLQRLALEKEQLEAHSYEQEIIQQAKVTPDDIQQYYTAHATDYDEAMVRHFVVRIKAADQAAGMGLVPEEAKAKAEAIRKELAAGTDIKKVIEEFNAPAQGVNIEVEPRKIRNVPNLSAGDKAAFALKDGEVSEIQDAPQMLSFVQKTGHSQADLKDVAPEIERTVKQQKIQAAIEQLKKNTTVWMDDQYFVAAPKPPDRPTMGSPVVRTPPKP